MADMPDVQGDLRIDHAFQLIDDIRSEVGGELTPSLQLQLATLDVLAGILERMHWVEAYLRDPSTPRPKGNGHGE
jgi:hypothetical protein